MLQLAEHNFGEPHLFGWFLGLAIGFAVIVVVVIVVSSILALASRIARQARNGTVALQQARLATLPIWELQQSHQAAGGILESARRARHYLEEQG